MINKLFDLFKQPALLIAGSIIGIIAISYEDLIGRYHTFSILVILLLTLYGYGALELIVKMLFWIVNKINLWSGEISIHAPYEVDESLNASWISVKICDLVASLKKNNIKVRVVKSIRVFSECPVIINPYGGVYPETDFSNLTSLNIIFQYVRNGGIYINISDIPFYYAYDKDLNRRIDTTPLAGDYSTDRSFLKTILTKRLNHYVFGLTSGIDFNEGVLRVIQLSTTSENLYVKDILLENDSGKYSPVVKIPYGNGYFIFSTLRITKDNLEQNITRVLKAVRLKR